MTRPGGPRAPRPGFTVVEVMLALALMFLVVGGVLGFLGNVQLRRAGVSRLAGELEGSLALVDRLESDLAVCVAGDERHGPGIRGDATSIDLLTRAVWLGAGRRAELEVGGDLQRSTLRFDAGAGRVTLERADGAGPLTPAETLADGLARVRFRYYDGAEWAETFDSGAHGGLPVAIEVGLWYGPPGSAPIPGAAPSVAESAAPRAALRAPDRLRVIVVPDGPVSAWKEGR
ncbi:MAG TPA: hypothetical protein VD963_00815 [Phycisphaerales bacterium]|nr:hypothetical protein [Phycisphaerales bacterium]